MTPANKMTLVAGTKYAQLTYLKDAPSRRLPSGQLTRRVFCKCDCGKVVDVLLSHLLRGEKRNCGCDRSRTHGMNGTREYVLWRNIKIRCLNKKCRNYKDYGGRGITISAEFKDDFAAFYKYIKTLKGYTSWANGNKKQLSLDRINNDKGYESGNLRFADRSTQAYNTRLYKSNTSGFRGVSCVKRDKLWVAYAGGKKKGFIGYYKTKEEAKEARATYLKEHFNIENN